MCLSCTWQQATVEVEHKEARQCVQLQHTCATQPKRSHLWWAISASSAINGIASASSRWSGQAMWTRNKEEDFQRTTASNHRLVEAQQSAFACDTALSRSRIDRVYTNGHVVNHLDCIHTCVALNWVRSLSTHRPLAFSRRRPTLAVGKPPSIPNGPCETTTVLRGSRPTMRSSE